MPVIPQPQYDYNRNSANDNYATLSQNLLSVPDGPDKCGARCVMTVLIDNLHLESISRIM